MEAESTRLVGTDAQGRVRWELYAASVAVDHQVTALKASGYVVGEDGTRVYVRAGRAVYRRTNNVLHLDGGVQLFAGPRRQLVAQEVTYEAPQDRLVATGGVRLRADGWTATADRLQGQPALRRVQLLGNVRVTAEGVR